MDRHRHRRRQRHRHPSKNYEVALALEVELERLWAKEKERRWFGRWRLARAWALASGE